MDKLKPHLNLFSDSQHQDYKAAEYLAHQMLHFKTRMLGRNYPGCSADLYNIGLLNLALADFHRAKRFLVRALQMQKLEGNRQDIAKTLQTLSNLHRRERPSFVLEKAC